MPVSQSHTFLAGVDTDTGDDALPANAARSMFNVAVERGYVTNAWGNEALPIDLPAGRNKVVGSFADADTGGEVVLVWNSAGQHSLYRYAPATRASTLLLRWAGLNLREDHYVTGGGIIADIMGYVDASGVIRYLSLTRAAAGEYTPTLLATDVHALDLAARTPAFAPVLSRQLNATAGDPRAALRLTHEHAWQVAYRYSYRDSDLTVLSPYSAVLPAYLVSTNRPLTNYVRIVLPDEELISPLVDYVELYARKDDSPVWRLVTTLRRASDGTLPRTYDFYGNTLGAGLSETETVKQRETIPKKVEAMTAAKNRFMMADLTEGDDLQPVALALVPEVARPYTGPEADATFLGGGVYTGAVQFYDHAGRTAGGTTPVTVTLPAQLTTAGSQRVLSLYWELQTTDPAALNVEIPANANTWGIVLSKEQSRSFFLKFRAADLLVAPGDLFEDGTNKLYRLWMYSPTAPLWATGQGRVWVDIGNLPDSTSGRIGYTFKAGSGDRLRLPEENLDVAIVGQEGDYLQIVWPRSTGPTNPVPLIEIYSPLTATEEDPLFENGPRYPVLRTVDGSGTEWRSYGPTRGALEPDAFLVTRQATTIFTADGRNANTGDDIAYHLVPPSNKTYLGQLIQSYNPEFFLRDKFSYSVPNAATVLNQFRVGGVFLYGTYADSSFSQVRVPLNIAVEAMNPDDAHYAQWLHGRGRPTATRLLGQTRRAATLRFTGALLPGTRLNGLRTMDALNERELAREQGAAVSLQLADQTQAEGTVLLVVQQHGAESFYLGQVQLSQATGQPLLAISDQVLSPGNPLSGGLGTTHPESVARHGGRVWYYDSLNNELVRYDRNGTLALAEKYKFQARMRELGQRHRGASAVGYYDPKREEYVLTFGATDESEAETVAFSERAGGFVDRYAFAPEWGMGSGDELVTFRAGVPHRHASQLPRNTFYGELTPSQLSFVAGGELGEVEKTWTGIGLRGSRLWLPATLRNAAGQLSTTFPAWFTRDRTLWQGALRRDQGTAGLPPARALHEGDKLQSPLLTVVLSVEGPEPAELVSVHLNYSRNAGQPLAPTR